jgi:hypothetical protein
MKDNFPYANYFLKENFKRLLHKEEPYSLPEIKGEKGELLSPCLLLLVGLNNNKVLNQPRIERIYSSIVNGSSFNKLTYSLKGYNAPVILLIRNTYNTIKR